MARVHVRHRAYLSVSFASIRTPIFFEFWRVEMEGTIKRITDKGFGFIENGNDKDMFFHSSALEGVRFDELREGQRVSYSVGQGPKGPRAENVQLVGE